MGCLALRGMAAGGAGTHGPTYVVGIDGSEPSLAAVRFVSGLARAQRADLVLAEVRVPETDVAPIVAPPQAGRRVQLAASSPDEGLEALAGRERSRLVAVGAPHRYGVGRLKPGGVTERLISRAQRAVLVVGADRADHPVRRVGVAHAIASDDPTPLAAAAALTRGLDADLEVITVVAPDAAAAPADHEEQVRATLGRVGVPDASARVVPGHPGPVLARAGDDLDLLVVGSAATAAPGRIGLGEVVRRVVAHARCPVLVVPRLAEG